MSRRFDWRPYTAPRFWSTWLSLGLFRLVALLPFRAQLATGRALGTALHACLPSRRRISRINVAVALPELGDANRRALVLDAFRHAGMGAVETACAWFCKPARYAERFDLVEPEHLDAAISRGKGVILLQAHFTLIDLSAYVMTKRWPIAAVYDDPKNALFAAWITHRRLDYMESMIDNRDIRSMVRRLRRGGIVWYSPDQTVSVRRGGIATRFFDRPVLSTAGTARMAAMTGAAVVPFKPTRDADRGRYILTFSPALDVDVDDPVAATDAINRLFEAQIREQPEQYFWSHKRFRPPNADLPDPYRRA